MRQSSSNRDNRARLGELPNNRSNLRHATEIENLDQPGSDKARRPDNRDRPHTANSRARAISTSVSHGIANNLRL